jgi:hypothetical protein
VLRVGLPTLLACVFAMGPVLAASTPGQAAHGVEALVLDTAQGAISAHDGHPDADGDEHHG